jgi:DNA-binding transcriptional LysR family regulator
MTIGWRQERLAALSDHFFVTHQAAEDGLGIGIEALPMLSIDIAPDQLVTPLPKVQVRRTGYLAPVLSYADRVSVSKVFVD